MSIKLSNSEMLKVKLAERKIFQHLEYGGKIDDAMGNTLLSNFLDKVSEIPTVVDVIQKYGNNIGGKDVAFIIQEMLRHLMPNPTISVGKSPVLVTTFIFMEIDRLDDILYGLNERLPSLSPSLSSEEADSVMTKRMIMLSQQAKEEAQALYDQAKLIEGETNFTIQDKGGVPTAGGCATVIILSGVLYYITNQISNIL